ncbi:D-glycero-beta-D-manno-heptose-7-phosphate kinase [bacterium]|nr:D-glycero-beta-D-manno-heptose-7-phosphate kinase [bacterium]MCG2677580.1 D-glycero-beta-D-manno-heptose-7-phosphate kinase [bacterium]
MRKRLVEIVNRFDKAKVLVIGDVMMDEYIWGDVSRISPEAPVPVVKVMKETFIPGGAANVVRNINSLGGKVYLAGIIGNDSLGKKLKKTLTKSGVSTSGLIIDRSRPTTRKTRIIAHSQQVVRIDKEKTDSPTSPIRKRLMNALERFINRMDIIIVSDYGKGIITSSILKKIFSLASKYKKKVVIDPKVGRFRDYRGATILTPNKNEARVALGGVLTEEESIHSIGKKILRELDLEALLITRGAEGMSLFQKDKKVVDIPTVAQEVYDVTGAGDTVTAVLALGLATGADFLSSAQIANFAAGIVVKEIGAATVSKKELLKRIRSG